MKRAQRHIAASLTLAASFLGVAAFDARADAIIDWSVQSDALIAQSGLGTPPAIRAMALVQTAALDAVNTLEQRREDGAPEATELRNARLEAAVAAAHRAMFARLIPGQLEAVEARYREAVANIPAGPARSEGIAAGEQAVAALLARRADDTLAPTLPYRPHAQAGSYVPTVTPAAPHWPQRRPWLMARPDQFRPAPPPELSSELWSRDYNEVKAYGGKVSAKRSAEQSEIARFWEYSLPAIYYGVARSVASMPDRDIAQNARLFATVAQAMDDALIGVFDAKYHYHFWRPATAIRNGDLDGNDRTERDAAWDPFIGNPLHPEYPSAHSILAAAVAAVLEAELGGRPAPELTTTSPTAKGVTRRWTSLDAFAREVAEARIYEGIHFRTSTEIGAAMGRQIGDLAAAKLLGQTAAVPGTPARTAEDPVASVQASGSAGDRDRERTVSSSY